MQDLHNNLEGELLELQLEVLSMVLIMGMMDNNLEGELLELQLEMSVIGVGGGVG